MVIDDCSEDDSMEILETEFPNVRREKTPRNLGFQGANNYAAELAESRIIMPMNNDMKLHEKSLHFLSRHFDKGDVFAVSGKFFDWDETTFLYGNRGGFFSRGHFYLYEKPPNCSNQTLFACGGALMVDRRRYLELGGFDTIYHPLYYEEIDLSYRALRRGWRVLYEPKSIAYHKVQGTITKQNKQHQINLISARNNYLFVWRNILDKDMTVSFIFGIPMFLFRDLFRLKTRFWLAFIMALWRLPQAIKTRKKEKKAAKLSDRAILKKVNEGFFEGKLSIS
tara:strand:- start:430 stop:1272 length:843 start_codon:yes stop_codon:yes gene_type:complete